MSEGKVTSRAACNFSPGDHRPRVHFQHAGNPLVDLTIILLDGPFCERVAEFSSSESDVVADLFEQFVSGQESDEELAFVQRSAKPARSALNLG